MATLDDAIDSGPTSAGGSGHSIYIGVPDDYTAQVTGRDPKFNKFMGPVAPSQYTAIPQYKQGDEYKPAASASPAQIQQIQEDLVQAGLIERGTKFRYGVYDEVTRKAYKKLLEYANSRGVDDGTAVDELKNAPDVNDSNGKPLQYSMPDPEQTKEMFRKASVDTLGRSLDTATLDSLNAAYQQKLMDIQQKNFQNAAVEGAQMFDAPDAATFAQQQIRQQNPTEAQAHDFSGAYDEFSNLIKQSANVQQY